MVLEQTAQRSLDSMQHIGEEIDPSANVTNPPSATASVSESLNQLREDEAPIPKESSPTGWCKAESLHGRTNTIAKVGSISAAATERCIRRRSDGLMIPISTAAEVNTSHNDSIVARRDYCTNCTMLGNSYLFTDFRDDRIVELSHYDGDKFAIPWALVFGWTVFTFSSNLRYSY
jgi:hypothetical protein